MKKKLLPKNLRKRLPGVTTFKWLRRSLLTLLMVLSVTSILDTTNWRTLKQLRSQDKCPIRWIENKMNSYLNNLLKTKDDDYVIASDTDSIYLNLGPLVDKFFGSKSGDKTAIVSILDKICEEKFEPYIEKCYQELADYVSAYDQKMQMKRENIADRGIWTAKKRYILNVWNSEGVQYSEAKLKMMGIEAVKSSTPAPCRKMIKDALKIDDEWN